MIEFGEILRELERKLRELAGIAGVLPCICIRHGKLLNWRGKGGIFRYFVKLAMKHLR